MERKEKIKFRASSVWKKFRLKLLEARNYTCEISGLKRRKDLQVHHLQPENYTDLDPSKFMLLTKAEHRNLERLLLIKNFNIDEYCRKLKDAYIRSKHGS